MSDQKTIPCRECGGTLSYAPGTTVLKCEFCGSENTIDAAGDAAAVAEAHKELDFHEAIRNLASSAATEEVKAIKCPGCAAEVSFDANALAEECPFCATALTRDQATVSRHPKAQAVLPFAFEERTAREKMKDWLGGLWFAPSALKQYAEAGRPMAGTYLPHYTYDAEGDAWYRGERGDAYYVTRTRTVTRDGETREESYQSREIDWTPVSGHVFHSFDDVLVPASETMGRQARTDEEGQRTWDLAELKPYRTEFLAGFRAETPTLGIEDGFGKAREVMKRRLEREARNDIGGDEQRLHSVDDNYSAISFKHVLLPVWLASYRYNNKPYSVVINGRTGEVRGERPYSAIKIAIAVVVGLAVIAGIAYGYYVSR